MTAKLMLLPAREHMNCRLVRVPDEFEAHEAFRRVTALIASVEEKDPDHSWEDIEDVLEEHGFEPVGFMLGPELD